ncbi:MULTISPECIES: ubiquitin-like protein Pup [Janibacter]|jgi:ubiquitin-like protein Pup|uniref:Prokaryotic ubiquitin-like protein Pup n=1 Tax=Janibacter melonis TaxID=262209 RepID=A0A176QBK7_9MICO|nr:ubiquitin-like protein Pup [Janibacter melonis]MBD5829580.1 ubiquitin-like protein Pup [Janibacter melonis]MCB5990178.1 ubiquitin-like protein Pup [Janibacter melonis]MCM3554567.1 ubiquitin-like protein Pup [Janibacter melonis]OAB87075.1 ubiquitin [Janibacter melonis]
MAGQEQVRRSGGGGGDETPGDDAFGQVSASNAARDEGLDSVLSDIDGVLETNAEEFVKSFVQKGGE